MIFTFTQTYLGLFDEGGCYLIKFKIFSLNYMKPQSTNSKYLNIQFFQNWICQTKSFLDFCYLFFAATFRILNQSDIRLFFKKITFHKFDAIRKLCIEFFNFSLIERLKINNFISRISNLKSSILSKANGFYFGINIKLIYQSHFLFDFVAIFIFYLNKVTSFFTTHVMLQKPNLYLIHFSNRN